MISVLVPVRNGGAELDRCLERVAAQRAGQDHEVLVLDPGSTDDTVAIAERRGARVYTIPVEDFHHGVTRNLCARLAEGEILLYTTHDAYPRVGRLSRGPRRAACRSEVAGVYGRQLAHSTPERHFLGFLYGERRDPACRVDGGADDGDDAFLEADSAIRRSASKELPTADHVLIADDQDSSRACCSPVTRSSTSRVPPCGIRTPTRCSPRSNASSSRASRPSATSSPAATRRAGCCGARPWPTRPGAALALDDEATPLVPYTAAYELGRFLGLRLNLRDLRLPPWLKRRWTRHPGWFTEEGQPGRYQST